MNELTQMEKEFLAIAIQGVCVRQGPAVFHLATSVARKLDLEKELKGMLQSWIEYSQTGSGPGKETTE